jgi:hypothetical protein
MSSLGAPQRLCQWKYVTYCLLREALDSVLLYRRVPLSPEEASILIDELNQPNRQFTHPYNLPDIVELSPAPEHEQVGRPVDELVNLHKQWVASNGIDAQTQLNASIFFVVDEETSQGRTVQVVNTLDVEGERVGDENYQSVRAPVAQAILAYTILDGGQQGWDFILEVASENDGIYTE